MIDTQEQKERFVLVGISVNDNDDCNESLDELAELVETAGGEVCGRIVQRLEHPHPGTYLGKGKLEELRQMVAALHATGIVCDDELSPAQIRNMEQALNKSSDKALDTVICDRTLLILDIFASRASSKEGKLQVELAQLKYRAARLVGLRSSMSRLGGGIGTRGPGEKKLEMDRRLIHERIGVIKEELRQVVKNRETQKKKRLESPLQSAMLVGYTNVGKSTLLNTLTDASVLSEDKLFATLDSTTRIMPFPTGEQLLVTDTVGFIRKLPHDLIDAFKSTLEEAMDADILLHVVDCSSSTYELQMQVVRDTLRDLKVEDKTVVTVFNKCDRIHGTLPQLRDFTADYSVVVSAQTGEGLDELKAILLHIMRADQVYVERLYSYEEVGKLQNIRKYGQLLSEEYLQEGIQIKAWVPSAFIKSVNEESDD